MKNINYTNHEISRLIGRELSLRRWSVRKCCEEFNCTHQTAISKKVISSLDKDFVQRVKNGKFKVLSERILRLCLFLEIDLSMHPTRSIANFSEETQLLERVLLKKPHLTITMRSILENLLTVAEGECNEVR